MREIFPIKKLAFFFSILGKAGVLIKKCTLFTYHKDKYFKSCCVEKIK